MNEPNSRPDAEMAQLTEEQLLLQLGEQIAEHEKFMHVPTPNELVMKARVWVESRMPVFRTHVCTERIHTIVKNGSGELVAAIADLIAAVTVGVSPVTVAYLLSKRGVTKLCKQEWTALEQQSSRE